MEPCSKSRLITDTRYKSFCSIVFDYLDIDSTTRNIVFPTDAEDILGVYNIWVPQHSETAACICYKNKNPLNDQLFYCGRDILRSLSDHIQLSSETILVTSNGDYNTHLSDIENIPHKACMAGNLYINDKKYIPLPRSVRAKSLNDERILLDYYNQPAVKYKDVYIKFSLETNKDRTSIYSLCKQLNLTKDDNAELWPVKEWIRQAKEHYFVISPESAGIDSARTWDALYVQSIPVVKRSIVTEFYSQIFPMVILDDWNELKNYKFDCQLYHNIMSKYPNYIQYLDSQYLFEYLLSKLEV